MTVELDFSFITKLKIFLSVALFSVAAYYLIWPYLSSILEIINRPGGDGNFKRRDSGRSSDSPPPKGFTEHLQVIENTAPNANTEVWWKYAKAGLTEVEVAISEAKLARKAVDKKPEAIKRGVRNAK